MGIPSWLSSSFGFQELKNMWGKDLVYTLLFSVALGPPSTHDFLLFHPLVLVFPSFSSYTSQSVIHPLLLWFQPFSVLFNSHFLSRVQEGCMQLGWGSSIWERGRGFAACS